MKNFCTRTQKQHALTGIDYLAEDLSWILDQLRLYRVARLLVGDECDFFLNDAIHDLAAIAEKVRQLADAARQDLSKEAL